MNEQLTSFDLVVVSEETLCNISHCLIQDDTLYYSNHYRKVKKRNSYTVKFKSVDSGAAPQYGQVQFFVSLSNRIFAFVSKFEPHVVSCQAHFGITHNSLDVLHVSKTVPIQGKCVFLCQISFISVFVSIDDDLCKCQYIVSFLNGLRQD